MTIYNGTGGNSASRGIAFDGANMWTANYITSTVTKIFPNGTMTNYSVGGKDYAIAFDGYTYCFCPGLNLNWTVNMSANCILTLKCNLGTGNLSYISGFTNLTNYTGVATLPIGIASDKVNVWTTGNNGNITKVFQNGTMTNYTMPTSGLSGIAFDGTNMWITNGGQAALVS